MAGSTSGNSLGPLFIRFALGVTFLWAGFGKVLEKMPVEGRSAATLANMGVIEPVAPAPQPESAPAKPPVPGDVTKPDPEKPGVKPETKPDDKPEGKAEIKPLMSLTQDAAPAALPATGDRHTAAEFPQPVMVRAVYGIALAVHDAANPAPAADGVTPMPLLPPKVGADRWPVYLAWACAASELLGGLFVLVGLLTRVSALSLVVTMGMAMWLTRIGPAIQSNDALLGFLPNHPAYAHDAAGNALHAVLLWQFLLFCAALSLVFSGAGALSFDRALLPPLGRREAPRQET